METTKRTFFKKLSVLLAGLTGIGVSGFRSGLNRTNIPDPFVHVVFFWLKEPGNNQARRKFEKELSTFIANVEEISSSHIGTPADTPDRPVVDRSYSYSLVTTFKSRKDYDIYADHPYHLKFIENAGDLWEKVLVYDSAKLI